MQFPTGHQIIIVAYEAIDDSSVKLPSHIKFREKMNIVDVLMDSVLHLLPAKVLARFKIVAKNWNLKISTPIFARDQTYYFKEVSGFFCQPENSLPKFVTLDHFAYGIPSSSLGFLPERVQVRSSCSGLLLCQGRDEILYVCNPVIKEWKPVLPAQSYQGSKPAIVLAFEPSLNHLAIDYQLACATPQLHCPAIFIDIYSSKKDSWEYDVADYWGSKDVTVKAGGFFLNGKVYWELSSGEVLDFELHGKKFKTWLLPPNAVPHGVLTQMNSELCYIHAHKINRNSYMVDIYGGSGMSLKRSITLDVELVGSFNMGCRALACIKRDMIAVLIGNTMYSFELNTRKVEVISRNENTPTSSYIPYVNSLPTLA